MISTTTIEAVLNHFATKGYKFNTVVRGKSTTFLKGTTSGGDHIIVSIAPNGLSIEAA